MTIPEERRKTVRMLFDEGKGKKEIARLLGMSVKTVRKILNGDAPRAEKRYSPEVDVNLLDKLYRFCGRRASRTQEVLKDELGIEIGYSTLTRLLRKNGIGQKANKRVHRFGDIPGVEMQHDTTVYSLEIGGRKRKVVCSGLCLRYSKMRYIKFYFGFHRFNMKCFLHQALTFWGYSAAECVIDNTNLAVLHGTGREAEFAPEMVRFAGQYGFTWIAMRRGTQTGRRE